LEKIFSVKETSMLVRGQEDSKHIQHEETVLPATEFPLNPLSSLKLVLKQIILVGQI
jgi:hypothetical protein